MKQWIEVPPAQTFSSHSERLAGTDVDVFISPYNVPRAICAEKSPDGEHFMIYIKYLDGEEGPGGETRTSPDGVVRVFYGKTSGRVAQLEITLSRSKERANRLRRTIEKIEKALSDFQANEQKPSRKLNYRAASEAIELSKSGLYAAL
jgi:hypothetical protein